jgi:hypothetical protein
MLYYKLNETPGPRPTRIILPNGLARTQYSESELAEAGYKLAPPKPQATFPQRVDWFNNEWVVRDPTEGEINTQLLSIKKECRARLDASDYRVTKALEAGESVPEAWRIYRQRLRDIFNNIDVPDIWHVEWPEAPKG